MKSYVDIFNGKGFHLAFENGYIVSVQFGAYNDCEHHLGFDIIQKMDQQFTDPEKLLWKSPNAEVCVIDSTTEEPIDDIRDKIPELDLMDMTTIGMWGEAMYGYVSSDNIARIITYVQQLPPINQ